MKRAVAIVFLVLPTAVAMASPPSMTEPSWEPMRKTPDEAPPLSGSRLTGELLAGTAVGAGGLLLGVLGGRTFADATGCKNEMCLDRHYELGGAAGLVAAAPLAVYAVGSIGNQTGSLAATYAGGIAGGLTGLALLELGEGNEAAGWLAVAAPIFGAMIGFNATRRYERDRRMPAWLPSAHLAVECTTFGVTGRF
jgi:hypothetical protein